MAYKSHFGGGMEDSDDWYPTVSFLENFPVCTKRKRSDAITTRVLNYKQAPAV